MDITFRLATLLLIVVVLCPSISAGAYKPPSSVNLGILATEISPQPARPGEDMFVKISIQNYGNNPAEDVTLDLEEFFPFHFKYSNTGYTGYGESKHYTSTAIIIPKISAYSSYEAYYYFTVDPLAKSGEYELTFKIQKTEGGNVGTRKNIKIDVEGNPDLALINSSISPQIITPGDEIILKTNLTSVGTGNVKNIRVSLVLDDLPAIIALDDSSKFIQKLDAGESKTVLFHLKISKDAKITSYNLPIKLTGVDEAEKLNITLTEVIGFDVQGKAKLSIASIKTDPLLGKVNEEMTLMIRLENVGEGDATSVKASIKDLPFSGVKEAFLGEIKVDDDSPAVFTIIPDKGGEFNYTLSIDYEDDFGEHTITEELNLVVKGDKNGNAMVGTVIIILIVLVTAGFYYFKILNEARREEIMNTFKRKNQE
ncbi:MAG: COG1361 S-layer family protein [Candidatus Heimdallarchaeota archaeon]